VAEYRLTQATALGGTQPREERIGDLLVSENAEVALASVAARLNRLSETLAAGRQYLGTELPGPQRMTDSRPVRAWWSGPEQWLFEAPLASHELLADEIKQIFGQNASVTEQTGGWCAFEITGPQCLALFERLCSANVRAMQAGDALRSSIEHMSSFILCNEQGQSYSIRGPGSSAASLFEALLAAAKSVAVT